MVRDTNKEVIRIITRKGLFYKNGIYAVPLPVMSEVAVLEQDGVLRITPLEGGQPLYVSLDCGLPTARCETAQDSAGSKPPARRKVGSSRILRTPRRSDSVKSSHSRWCAQKVREEPQRLSLPGT